MAEPRTDPPRGLLNLDISRGPAELHRYLPSTKLKPVVEHFWSVRWDLHGQPPFTSESLPFPSMHLIVENGRWRLTGVTTKRFFRTLVDSGKVFGIKFTPGGFRPFVEQSVTTFTDQTLPAATVLPWVHDLPQDAWQPDEESVERTEAVLLEHLAPEPDPRIDAIHALIEAIAEDRQIVRVEQIVQRSGLSVRALQRLFREYVGVSPKWVIQRYRLFEAAERLAGGDDDGAQVAQALGYFDQAHFIRDFKALVGQSPSAYAEERRKRLGALSIVHS